MSTGEDANGAGADAMLLASDMSEFEKDALKEFFNMGLGMAASSLSEMVRNEILLSLPQLAVATRDSAVEFIGSHPDDRMVAIRQRFRGGLNGTVLLIFPGAKSLELVRTLLGDDMPLETLTELEQETLLDVGNVILNSFLASFTEMMTMEFEFESAEFLRATCRELLDARAHTTGTGGDDRLVQAREQAVLLMMDFRTGDDMPEKVALHGFIVMLFSDEEMLALRRELQQILSRF